MSRTRKTKPVFARLRAREIPLKEWHNCDRLNRECDLPEKPQPYSRRTLCEWVPRSYDGLFGRSRGERDDAREDRRTARRRGRRVITEELELAQQPDYCTCPCHRGPDHCAICTNDYADLCYDGQ